ncbi:MAG: hypothetical protein NZ480_04150 [Bdellovibrionaceae bacterium]|nr:hypothetical protein [Pseudobdellovibrionaceae bacterium]MDW8189951.1 hypothetical protein [Pseudobdellovibrionaceae bacterium]
MNHGTIKPLTERIRCSFVIRGSIIIEWMILLPILIGTVVGSTLLSQLYFHKWTQIYFGEELRQCQKHRSYFWCYHLYKKRIDKTKWNAR